MSTKKEQSPVSSDGRNDVRVMTTAIPSSAGETEGALPVRWVRCRKLSNKEGATMIR